MWLRIRNQPQQWVFHCFLFIAIFSLSVFHTAEVVYWNGKGGGGDSVYHRKAANLSPCPITCCLLKGQVAELRGNVDEAKRWYEEALSISPTHVKTMQRLVSARCLSANWNPFAVLHFHVYLLLQCSWFQVLLFLWERLVVCLCDRHGWAMEREARSHPVLADKWVQDVETCQSVCVC